MKNIEIIRPAVSDAESIIKHLNKVGGETDNLTYGENEFGMTVEQEKVFLAKIEKKEIKASFFIAKNEDGEVIAVATCFPKKRQRFSHITELGISVQKEYWGQGIGDSLMDSLIEDCTKLGIEKIGLRVNADNEEATNLYNKKGFEVEGLLKKEKKVGNVYQDTYILAKFL